IPAAGRVAALGPGGDGIPARRSGGPAGGPGPVLDARQRPTRGTGAGPTPRGPEPRGPGGTATAARRRPETRGADRRVPPYPWALWQRRGVAERPGIRPRQVGAAPRLRHGHSGTTRATAGSAIRAAGGGGAA